MKEILLTKGKVALVDDSDYEKLSKYRWYATKNQYTSYAVRHERQPDGKKSVIQMHRQILGAACDGLLVDHKDGCGINNQRSNLRPATCLQNTHNSRKHKSGTSHFKGVSWHNRVNKWRAAIKIEGRERHIGYFDSEESAARAYDKVANQFFKEFAVLNFPPVTSR